MNMSKFKVQCFQLLDELGPDGLVITRRGEPIAKVTPITGECANLIGSLKGRPRDDTRGWRNQPYNGWPSGNQAA
jgi:antitoxin (DNA-binding transcriptional repressor) of toxin-antitoxin stability system